MTTRRIVASLLAFLLGAHPLSAVLPAYAVRGMSSACPTSAATLEAAYAYDNAGNLTGIAYSNGIEAGYTYDAAYRLHTVTWTDTATQQLVAQFDCDVNALGLRTAISEAVQQPGGGGVDTDLVEYEYDKLGRLTRETRTRGQDVLVDKSYQYDLFGNRKKVINHIGPSEQDATFNELHQLETDGNLTFDYDASGNLYEKKQGDTVLTRYEYDFLNRLSKVTHNPGEGNEQWQTYEYDAEGGLTRTETDTGAIKRFVNDHHNVTGYHQALVELDGQSSVLARMVYGLDLVKMSRSGEYYYIYDPLGSTRALTDSDADVTDTYLYDAYGNVVAQSGTTENPYLFTGERLDAFTGFYYLRARFYDPATGRFTQLDTFLGSPQDPLSLHRYLYANADPLNRRDPSGRISVARVVVTMAAVGMVAGIVYGLVRGVTWVARKVGLFLSLTYSANDEQVRNLRAALDAVGPAGRELVKKEWYEPLRQVLDTAMGVADLAESPVPYEEESGKVVKGQIKVIPDWCAAAGMHPGGAPGQTVGIRKSLFDAYQAKNGARPTDIELVAALVGEFQHFAVLGDPGTKNEVKANEVFQDWKQELRKRGECTPKIESMHH